MLEHPPSQELQGFLEDRRLKLPHQVVARFKAQRLLLTNSVNGVGWRAFLMEKEGLEGILEKLVDDRKALSKVTSVDEPLFDRALIGMFFQNDEIVDLPIIDGCVSVPKRWLVGFRSGRVWLSPQDGYISLNSNRCALKSYGQPAQSRRAG